MGVYPNDLPLGKAKEPRLRARGGPLANFFQNVWTITMSCIQKADTLKSLLHLPWIFNIKGHHELHTEGGDTEVIAPTMDF